MKKASSEIDQNKWLEILDGSALWGCQYRAVAIVTGLKPAEPAEYAKASKALALRLKELVDAWIATGFRRTGSERTETPGKRKPSPKIQHIVANYLRTHGSMATWTEHGYQILFPSELQHQPKIDWQSADVEIVQTPMGNVRTLMSGRYEDHPMEIVEEEAQRLFVAMLFTDWSKKVAKCRACKEYWVREKLTSRSYKNGAMCRKCSSRAAANRRKAQVRKEKKRIEVTKAAVAMTKWWTVSTEARAHLGDEKDYIARSIGKTSTTWVTRNYARIAAKA